MLQNRGVVCPQSQSGEFRVQSRKFLRADPAQNRGLPVGRAEDPLAEAFDHVRQPPDLLRLKHPQWRCDLHGGAARWLGRPRTKRRHRDLAKPLEFLPVELLEGLESDILHEEAKPRAVPVLPIAVLVEDSLDRLGNQACMSCWNELFQQPAYPAVCAHTATGIHREALLAAPAFADESQVADRRARAIPAAP